MTVVHPWRLRGYSYATVWKPSTPALGGWPKKGAPQRTATAGALGAGGSVGHGAPLAGADAGVCLGVASGPHPGGQGRRQRVGGPTTTGRVAGGDEPTRTV